MTDIRLVFRRLAKSKGFTLTAVLTLALGIGGNAAMFTLIQQIMLKSLPVADPQRLIRLGDTDSCCVTSGYQTHFSIFSYSLYAFLRDHTPAFEELTAFQAGFGKVGVRHGDGAPEPFVDQFVSGNYFAMFGLHAFAGRLLEPEDDRLGAAPAAVMSYRAWQHFGADPALIGGRFLIDGAPFTIAGIAPPGFFGDTLRPDPPDFWLPLASEAAMHGRNSLLNQPAQHWLYIIGRIRPGAETASLESQLNVELKQWFLVNQPPQTDRDRGFLDKQHLTLAPGGNGVAQMKSAYENDLKLLLAITALVLIIACANLANLQLARGAADATQTAVRAALGASRMRLIRLSLMESVALALAGGLAGLAVATAFARLLIRLAFGTAPFVPIDTTPSLPVLGYAFLLSLITGVIFGVAPAWSGSRADPALALRGAGRATGGASLAQKSLVVVQAALSLVLLVGAGLMIGTLRNLQDQQFGFRMDGVMVVNVKAALGSYSPEKIATLYRDLERRMRAIPGVRSAALALYAPMSGNNWQSVATIEERPQLSGVSPSWDRVGPGFFETIGARIVNGRAFDERDTPDSVRVAVINKAFADRFLSDEDPIGKRFGLGGIEHSGDYQIIGVVENVRFRNPRQPAPPMFFLPLLQMSRSEWEDNARARSNMIDSLILRVTGNPPDLTARIQRELATADQNLTLLSVKNIQDQLGDLLGHERLLGRLAELFGALALMLASLGLYGVTAYSVTRRTGEIGVRTALGATQSRIIGLILKTALIEIGAGLAIGIPAALASGRLLADQLYGVQTSDPLILAAASSVLVLCALLAGLIPAWRASNIDPVRALKVEA